MTYKPDPANDPKDAYAVIPAAAEMRGPPTDRWTVTLHSVPVWHFPPGARHLATRFVNDPFYRLKLANKKKAHEH